MVINNTYQLSIFATVTRWPTSDSNSKKIIKKKKSELTFKAGTWFGVWLVLELLQCCFGASVSIASFFDNWKGKFHYDNINTGEKQRSNLQNVDQEFYLFVWHIGSASSAILKKVSRQQLSRSTKISKFIAQTCVPRHNLWKYKKLT